MKRRWKLWTGLALLPVLGLGFLHPAVYWPLIGWIRGEAFYQGRPTSFWQSEIRNRYIDLADSSLPMWTCLPSWWEGWLERIGMGSQLPWLDSPPLLKGDPASLPVLVELLQVADPKCRQVGVAGLGAFRDLPSKTIAVPALTAALDDPDPVVRLIAGSALQRMKDP